MYDSNKTKKLIKIDNELYAKLAEEEELKLKNETEFNKRLSKVINLAVKEYLLKKYGKKESSLYEYIGFWNVENNYDTPCGFFTHKMIELSNVKKNIADLKQIEV